MMLRYLLARFLKKHINGDNETRAKMAEGSIDETGRAFNSTDASRKALPLSSKGSLQA